jgi:hypothetical protein
MTEIERMTREKRAEVVGNKGVNKHNGNEGEGETGERKADWNLES